MISKINVELSTERLHLKRLNYKHNNLVLQLLNTEGWLKFIGDRNVHTLQDADSYIGKINSNENIAYWAVTIAATNEAIGLVTLIKRDYLSYPDIGFAFLLQFNNNGYAFEASHSLLQYLIKNTSHTTIQACTLPNNVSSIKLLEKLGLQFKEQITYNNELLSIYSYS